MRQAVTARREDSGPEAEQLLEAVVERENMWLALKQVERNKGAAGVDKMTVEQLRAYLREHWLRIKEELLAGELSTAAGAEGRDTEARWQRDADVGHSDGGRPTDSTGVASSTKPTL